MVQGVGFRPFVYNLALRCGVNGWVRNTSAGVEIQVEGDAGAVAAFRAALPREAPPRAFIASLDDEPAEAEGAAAFVILESAADPAAYQLVSPDIATCDDCRAELLDPADRRYHYPFTNCTNCGPRFTIIEALPYDRERTTMRRLPDVPGLPPRVRGPDRPPLPRRAQRLPGVRAAGALVEGVAGARGRRRAGRRPTPASCGRGDAGGGDPSPSPGRPSCYAPARSWRSRASAASTWPATPPTRRPCGASRSASGAPHKPLAVMFADLEQLRRPLPARRPNRRC